MTNIIAVKILFKQLFIVILFFLLMAIFQSKNILADAWVQKKGNGIFISSVSLQSIKALRDDGSVDKGKRAYQTILNLYAEYGLTNRITIGAKTIGATNTIAEVDNFSVKNPSSTSFGMNAGEIFSRIGIITRHDIIALAISTQIGMPSLYKKTTMSYFGLQSWSFETRAELGIKFSKNIFSTLSIGWHEYFKNTYDELRIEFAYGQYIIRELLVMFRFQYYLRIIKSINDKTYSSGQKDQTAESLFSTDGFAKISLSIATPISKNVMLESGLFSSISSKLLKTNKQNIDLHGFTIGLWFDF